MKKSFTTAVVLALLVHPASAGQTTNPFDEWVLIGEGFSARVDDAVLLSEYPGSKGIMLISPDSYGADVAIEFDIMPLNPESVLVAMIAASSSGNTLSFPDNYDGSISYLLESVHGYFFAFHNAAHNRTPFVRQHPFTRGESQDIAAASENIMSQRWHHIAISVAEKGGLQLRIDGVPILNAKTANPLGGGNVILRLRGTKSHTASALIKNFRLAAGKLDD